MLDKFIIFTKTGFILYEKSWTTLRGQPIHELIASVLAENREPGNSTTIDSHTFMWDMDNQLQVVFVACYQKVLQLNYVNRLLVKVKKNFISTFETQLKQIVEGSAFEELQKPFDSVFATILAECDTKLPRTSPAAEKKPINNNSAKNKKVSRNWGDKLTENEAQALDYSGTEGQQEGEEINSNFVDRKLLYKISQKGNYEIPEMEETEELEKTTSTSTWSNLLGTLTGNRKITKEDLEPLLKSFKEDLVKKNVAHQVADDICSLVSKNLVGSTVGTFDTLKASFSRALEASIRKILTPASSTDILREIHSAKQQRRPYVITFIGVNGVGKSTNLSKVCFCILQNKFSVLVAACDTFRSGAVEQLGVHVRNLAKLDANCQLELYQKGYGKDAAIIAKDAIEYARTKNIDVVLIDTAGRMQNNEPLMRSLAKLVSVNLPDKILFVGEALVGNEAIDQLTKFNQALKDYGDLKNPRVIDGMILTKFDTIDEKVGAALSMTYITGKPIYFVGTGQTYTDLKRLNVSQIVRILTQ